MKDMEVAELDDLAMVLRDCVHELSAVESDFIECCYLAEPKMTLKAFTHKHRLRPEEMADLRVRVLDRLREELARWDVHSVTDII